MDIQRHLEHEPVLARGPSTMYHLQKFLRRHRSQAIAAATIAVLAGALIAVLSVLHQKQRELAEAESLRAEADSFRHEEILTQVREHFAKAEYQKALDRVTGILNSPYVGPEAQLLYAGILVEGQRPDVAKTTLEALLDERPKIAAVAYSLLARVLWESESSDEEKLKKVDEYRHEADMLLPDTAEAYFLRAMTAPTIKDKLEMLDKALYVDPSHYESCRLRAFTYYASRKYEKLAIDARVMTAQRR